VKHIVDLQRCMHVDFCKIKIELQRDLNHFRSQLDLDAPGKDQFKVRNEDLKALMLDHPEAADSPG